MKQTITKSMFRDAFERMGRKDNFSYEGLGVLFDYLDDMDSDMELDVISLCCDFEEGTKEYFEEIYGEPFSNIRDNTIVLDVDKNIFIIQNY